MQYIGQISVMLAFLLLSREYTKYMKKRVRECEELLSFIAHLRTELGCYLSPVREAALSFDSPILNAVGFSDAVKNTENLYLAYQKIKKRLSISEEESKPLEALFSSLGKGYLEDEIKLICVCEEKVQKNVEEITRQAPKNIKLISTLSVTAAIGFFILII